MANGLIGRKLGMTRVFAEDGASVPVTVIEAGPCRVVQVKTDAVQLGFESRGKPQTTRALLGHAKKAGLEAAPWILREFAVGEAQHAAGDTVTVGIFAPGELDGWGSRLGEPDGRVHYAGAETSALPSFMEGAAQAGERAAAEVLAAG